MEDKLMEHSHDFDGIEELDNDLPRWWLGIFWVSMVLGIFYVPYYHFMHPEKLPSAAWEADHTAKVEAMAAAEAAAADVSADAGGAGAPGGEELEAALWAKYEAGGWQEAGKKDFDIYCMPCHAPDGGGTIGPNFTDDYYIHGGKLTDIQHIINVGVPAKGMISWKVSLKPDQIERLTFYIRSLRGTTPAVAKAAEGKLVDEIGNFVEGDEAAAGEEASPSEPGQ